MRQEHSGVRRTARSGTAGFGRCDLRAPARAAWSRATSARARRCGNDPRRVLVAHDLARGRASSPHRSDNAPSRALEYSAGYVFARRYAPCMSPKLAFFRAPMTTPLLWPAVWRAVWRFGDVPARGMTHRSVHAWCSARATYGTAHNEICCAPDFRRPEPCGQRYAIITHTHFNHEQLAEHANLCQHPCSDPARA